MARGPRDRLLFLFLNFFFFLRDFLLQPIDKLVDDGNDFKIPFFEMSLNAPTEIRRLPRV